MKRSVGWIMAGLCVGAVLAVSSGACSKFQTERPGTEAEPVAVEEEEEGKALPRQYKKAHCPIIAQIVNGQYDKVIKELEAYLKLTPDDAESLYCLAIAQAQKKMGANKAFEAVEKALKAGLPIERFVAGPRDLVEPLTRIPRYVELVESHRPTLVHGPTLGCVTDHSAKFWVRTADEMAVRVFVSRRVNGLTETVARSQVIKTRADRDYTAVVSVDGLEPNTRYDYELLVDYRRLPAIHSFETFPADDRPARFQVGFGGGAGYTPQFERMWNTVAAHRLPAFLLLGDNVYIDHPEYPQVQQYCYYRRQSRPEFRRFAAATSVFAIWDDHDFTTNDQWGGPAIEDPPWKRAVWNVFCENWNNPYYAGGFVQPGCWFDASIADVDFFFLDGRYYRESPKNKSPSMLGPVQLKWLLDKLKASKARFKVLASPVPWTPGAKPGSRDTWDGYSAEREEIFSCIEKNGISGVVLISADRHRSDIRKIERPNGYDFYEFESSKLTNVHTHKVVKGAIFGYNEKCSFGLLTFDTTKPDPEAVYQIYNIDDELIYTHTVRLSELTHSK